MNTSEQAIAVWNTRATVLESREGEARAETPEDKAAAGFRAWRKNAQPAPAHAQSGDVVEEMLAAYKETHDRYNVPYPDCDPDRLAMDDALAVANKHRDAQWSSWGIVELAARNQSVAEYMKHWEERATKAEANADFLRRSVGACHMMISRNDLAELDGEWGATDLPPRLKKYIMEARRGYYSAEQVGKAIREETGCGYRLSENDARVLPLNVLARLSAPKPPAETLEQKFLDVLDTNYAAAGTNTKVAAKLAEIAGKGGAK